MSAKTLGEQRVGVDFNPSGSHVVSALKEQAAKLIDMIDAIPTAPGLGGEIERLKALAKTDVESAAMWAVKAATKKP